MSARDDYPGCAALASGYEMLLQRMGDRLMAAREDYPGLAAQALEPQAHGWAQYVGLGYRLEATRALDEIDQLRASLAEAKRHLALVASQCDNDRTWCSEHREHTDPPGVWPYRECPHRAALQWLSEVGE